MLSETPEVVKALLDAGADLEALNVQGATPLALGEVPRGGEGVAGCRAAPNARIENGRTPLHTAAGDNKTPEVVKVLLAAGADLEARDVQGATPLHMAAGFSETPEVVKALLDTGADPSTRAADGKLPVELVPDDSPLRGTDVYWRLNEGRYR